MINTDEIDDYYDASLDSALQNNARTLSMLSAAARTLPPDDGDDDDDDEAAATTATSQLSALQILLLPPRFAAILHDASLLLTGQNPNDRHLRTGEGEYHHGDDGNEQNNQREESSFCPRISSSLVNEEKGIAKARTEQAPQQQQQQQPATLDSSTFSITEAGGGGGSIDFLKDDPGEMTWSRRIALHCLRRYNWYNPGLKKKQETTQVVVEGEHHRAREETAGAQHHQKASNTTNTYNDAYPFTHSRQESPNLEFGWAYWEHFALSRYVVDSRESLFRRFRGRFSGRNKPLEPAQPGESARRTALYSPIFTEHRQLGDFGIGFGLYFSTLRAITILTLVAGLLNVPNLVYFASEEYSGEQHEHGLPWLLKGSAICVNTSWVPCPDCRVDDFSNYRLGRGTTTTPEVGDNATTTTTTTFALRNNCKGATLQQGFINYATLFLVIVGSVVYNWRMDRLVVAFDEDEQTAQDYSIEIGNPPKDATDPEEWRKFFVDNFDQEHHGGHGGAVHVTTCTIAVDNDLLLKSLVERRELLRKIELMVEPGTSLDTLTLTGIAANEERKRRFLGHLKALILPGIPELFAGVVKLNAKIQGLAQQEYNVTSVFVTFETEAAQRRVLSELSVAYVDRLRKNKSSLSDPKLLFRGEHILRLKEPDEPSSIRWQDLNTNFKTRVRQQLVTGIATLVSVVVLAIIVYRCNRESVTLSAYAIAFSNIVFPMFARILTDLESHRSQEGRQRSLYYKITLIRWVNTAIVITIIYPFTDTLRYDGGLIQQIYALFFAEIVTTNVIQLLDPVGHLRRHILAPRTVTQDAMNLNFSGQIVELAERYTNMTKIFFLTLWYSAIYPASFFMCAIALGINYYTDRFSLMRTWKRAPRLGTGISSFSRRCFFSLTIVTMAILSSYYWSGFPYDNLCENDGTAGSYGGNWTVSPLDNAAPVPVTIAASDPTYRYCLQDFLRYPSEERSFPFVPSNQPEGDEWMTQEQEVVTHVYGWTAVGVLTAVVCLYLCWLFLGIRELFNPSYTEIGDDQNIPFSEVPSIATYIPEVESPVFSRPLLACNVDGIDPDLFGWYDPHRPHSFYDLTKDAKVLVHGRECPSKVVFSSLTHWPPATNHADEE